MNATDLFFLQKRIEKLTEEKRDLRKMISEQRQILEKHLKHPELVGIHENVLDDLETNMENILVGIWTIQGILDKEQGE